MEELCSTKMDDPNIHPGTPIMSLLRQHDEAEEGTGKVGTLPVVDPLLSVYPLPGICIHP
jgi:hypothetical protein